MIRTQVYLTKEIDRQVKRVAALSGKSQAEVIRDALSEGLKGRTTQRDTAQGLLALAALGRTLKTRGPANLSQVIDHELYEN